MVMEVGAHDSIAPFVVWRGLRARVAQGKDIVEVRCFAKRWAAVFFAEEERSRRQTSCFLT